MKTRFLILAVAFSVCLTAFGGSFTIEAESMDLSGNYAGKTSSPFSGIALYADGDQGSAVHAFPNGDGIYTISLVGASNNSSMAGVSLYINDVKVKAFAFYGSASSTLDVEVKITELKQSDNTIKLLLETDNGSSDTFVDKITFTYEGEIVVKDPPVLPAQGAYYTGEYRNMLKEAGYTDAQISKKKNDLWNHFFYGDAETQAVYYPVGDDEAYILDTGNDDIRSEGMSYGMMICVQMDKQAEFDRLWKWAKTKMQHQTGARKGYFAWQMNTNGTIKDENTASDGEEYFVMALMFASGRWGDGDGIYNYSKEANDILKNCMNKEYLLHTSVTNLFNATEKQVVFVPYSQSAAFTDPSYHLPAFYQLWSLWADTKRPFWAELADKSREMFPKFANAQTGLMPDYANFDGTPTGGSHADFRYDAWRCIMNMAMDYAWFKADEMEVTLVKRIHDFFASQGVDSYGSEYALTGEKLNSDHSPGLVACNASGALASTQTVAWDFIEDFFMLNIPTGTYRYYDGLLYFLNYLNLSGNYRIYEPENVLEIALDEQYNYIDDYLILDDFEPKAIGEEYYMRKTENSPATALNAENPDNGSEKSLHILTGNYDEYLVMEFTLPKERTLKDDYSQLEFDIFYTQKADDGNHNQDLKIDFDEIKNPSFFSTKTGDRANHGKWEHISIPLTGVTSGNSFKLYICIRANKADFYIDNVKLKAKYSLPTHIPENRTNDFNIYYSNEMLYPNITAENYSIYNLNGHLVACGQDKSVINISALSSGMYILYAQIADKVYVRKFIK